MAVTKMEQGTGRSRSKLNNKQVQQARDRAEAMRAGPAPTKKPTSSPSVLSPIIGIPAIGGGDQMKRNTDALRAALGGRRAAPRTAPNRPKDAAHTGGGGKSAAAPGRRTAVKGVDAGPPGRRMFEDGSVLPDQASKAAVQARMRAIMSRTSGEKRARFKADGKRR